MEVLSQFMGPHQFSPCKINPPQPHQYLEELRIVGYLFTQLSRTLSLQVFSDSWPTRGSYTNGTSSGNRC